MSDTDDAIGFEAARRRLEESVAALESGDLGLDASLKVYEEGVRHLARCHALLDAAEKAVALVTGVADDGRPETAPFDATATVEAESPAPAPARRRRRAATTADPDDDLPS